MILKFEEIRIFDIIIVKRSWFGKKIFQWRRLDGDEKGAKENNFNV